jgi:hypothetical protein
VTLSEVRPVRAKREREREREGEMCGARDIRNMEVCRGRSLISGIFGRRQTS